MRSILCLLLSTSLVGILFVGSGAAQSPPVPQPPPTGEDLLMKYLTPHERGCSNTRFLMELIIDARDEQVPFTQMLVSMRLITELAPEDATNGMHDSRLALARDVYEHPHIWTRDAVLKGEIRCVKAGPTKRPPMPYGR